MQDQGRYGFLEVLYLAIKIEDRGYDFYSALADSTINLENKKLFNFLAQQEKNHRQTFQGLENNFKGSQPESNVLIRLLELTAFADKNAFLINRIPEIKKSVRTANDLIDVAISGEGDTIYLYNEFIKFVKEDEKDLITEIIKQEENHKELLLGLKEQRKNT